MEEGKLAILWKKEKIKNLEGVRCNLCARRCFILKGKRGVCLVRENINNKLYTLNYGKVVALNIDPIEKKPHYHFYPGSFSLSYACGGCNWRCLFCQNWEISKMGLENKISGNDYKPEEIVETALKNNLKIITHTYTEPTIFLEFALDIMKYASQFHLKNTFVTNGYMSEEALRLIRKYLDAAVVDFKASGDLEFHKKISLVPDVEPIFENLKLMKKFGIHIEISDLIVPKMGDNLETFRKLVKWILDELGEEVPFHILRFFPHYKMLDFPPTPIETLEKMWKEAKALGLKYVYIGNVPGHEAENTYCPNCKRILIRRFGYRVENYLKTPERPNCNTKINVVM
ncbi:MAG: AmmeMemoRadiSam system radical SAM enzyme [Candidatus Aenigmatarchaeota archaeon]